MSIFIVFVTVLKEVSIDTKKIDFGFPTASKLKSRDRKLKTRAGGWELIYNFVHHILGEATKYSGVPMHIGHYRSHIESQIQQANPGAAGFFAPEAWREFIQSGVAAKLLGMPRSVREPCCELRYIGGDGTGIGIPVASVHHIPPVWMPPEGVRQPSVDWGRLDRCAIGSHEQGSADQKKKSRDFLKRSTTSGISKQTICEVRDTLNDYSEVFPPELLKLLENWFTIDKSNTKWDPIRRLLNACACQDSLFGIVTANMLPRISQLIKALTKPTFDGFDDRGTSIQSLFHSIQGEGMGPEIVAASAACVAELQLKQGSGVRCTAVFASFLQFIGMCFLICFLMCFSCAFCAFQYLYDHFYRIFLQSHVCPTHWIWSQSSQSTTVTSGFLDRTQEQLGVDIYCQTMDVLCEHLGHYHQLRRRYKMNWDLVRDVQNVDFMS